MCQQPLFVLRLPHLIESAHSLIWGIAFGNGTIHNLERLGTHFYERLLIHLFIYFLFWERKGKYDGPLMNFRLVGLSARDICSAAVSLGDFTAIHRTGHFI